MKVKFIVPLLFLAQVALGQSRTQKIDSLLNALYTSHKFNGNVLVAEKGTVIYSRSFGTGVAVYTVALILESVFHINFWETIVIICVVTMLYSLKGGLKVVVYTDVIQMF